MATTPNSILSGPLFELVYQGKWIAINRLPLELGCVTHRYEVLTRKDSTCIAEIRWYGRWWCYVLAPREGSIWESRCLRDVVAFLEQLKKDILTRKDAK